MHEYAAFATDIASQIPLRLPPPADEPGLWSLRIVRGDPPPATLTVRYEDIRYGAGPDWLQVDVPWVARYHVHDDAMTVAAVAGADDEAVGRYLVGFVLPLLLRRRPLVLLHGSAVADEHGAVVVTGEQGAGKSTTAAALVAAGLRPLCDDVVPVAEGPIVLPGIAEPKLLPDAYERLLGDPGTACGLFDGVDKFQVPMGAAGARSPLRAVFVLDRWAGSLVRLTPLTGVAKMTTLAANLAASDALADAAGQLARLASWMGDVRVTKIDRPAEADSIDRIVEIIRSAHRRQPNAHAT